MKASTKLISLLLLVAMCMSFMAIPAYATDEALTVGRVSADMMADEPEVEETMVIGTEEGNTELQGSSTVVAAQPQTSEKRVAPVVIKLANGGEASYESLGDALAAASAGDVIQLNTDFSFTNTLTIEKAVTILLNGHKLKVTVPGVKAGLAVSGATLRGGSVVVAASEVETKEGEEPPVYLAGITGSLTLDDVDVTYTGPGRMMNAVATVFGGSYSSDPSIYLPDGYKAVPDGDRFIVVEKTEEDEEEAAGEETPAENETPVEGQQPVEGQ